MANTQDYKRRIKSVKNTAQLTKAMKMVSAAKLRRAQDAMIGARPFAAALKRTLAGVAKRADSSISPLLASRDIEKVDLIVVTADRGLCGSFNASIIKSAEAWREAMAAEGKELTLTTFGRKATDYYRRRPHIEVRDKIENYSRSIEYKQAADVAKVMEERFTSGETDAVYLAFNEFKNVVSQNVVVEPLLPFSKLEEAVAEGEADDRSAVDYIYEPSPQALLEKILSRFVAFELYHALLESTAAEHAARMTAMDSASRNARDMIDKLTLTMNRIRQASITTEIIEVVSGAAALGK